MIEEKITNEHHHSTEENFNPTSNISDFSEWRQAIVEFTTSKLSELLQQLDPIPSRLLEATRYAVFSGGKRVRPMLCHAAGELTDADPRVLANISAALEMLHIFSLIQDDLPDMDNDSLRHGKPTLHVKYDVATALLVCDGLITLAFQILTELDVDAQRKVSLIRELALASGYFGMTSGQYIDITSVGSQLTQSELEHMHKLKTGSLTRASVRMGAICGISPCRPGDFLYENLTNYADHIGLAYQVIDDILDATISSEQLGKTANKDYIFNKPTYATLLDIDDAQNLAIDLSTRACESLLSYGNRALRLNQLIDFIVYRKT
ncbi:geranyltranstransferase [Burkholderia lata]|nr:geranyltranstransferase [Burkholderia lata]